MLRNSETPWETPLQLPAGRAPKMEAFKWGPFSLCAPRKLLVSVRPGGEPGEPVLTVLFPWASYVGLGVRLQVIPTVYISQGVLCLNQVSVGW